MTEKKKRLVVLFAEDNEDDVFFMQSALSRCRITDPLHVVPDGVHALDYLRGANGYENRKKHPMPDVVISDLKMPGKTGLEVLRWLRQESDFRGLPFVILSSSPDQSDIDQAYESGANAYLVKKSDMAVFSATIKNLYDFWKETAELPEC